MLERIVLGSPKNVSAALSKCRTSSETTTTVNITDDESLAESADTGRCFDARCAIQRTVDSFFDAVGAS